MEETQYNVLITKKGEQIPVQTSVGVTVGVIIPGDPVVNDISLDLSPDEFKQIQELAKTNSIGDDILSSNKE